MEEEDDEEEAELSSSAQRRPMAPRMASSWRARRRGAARRVGGPDDAAAHADDGACGAQSGDNRLASVRRLIELLRGAGGALAALEAIIKGGRGALRSLDTSVYAKERHAAAWVAEFKEAPAERQVELMAVLFMHLPQDEQRMVVGSLA